MTTDKNECPNCPSVLKKSNESIAEEYWKCTNPMCGYVERRPK